MKILIFGGTGEARELANCLVKKGHEVTTSLAGKTQDPLLPGGLVRTGGYGEPSRLRTYINDGDFDFLVDATHPFAEKMSATIAAIAEQISIPMLRLCRPAWERPEAANWIEIDHPEQIHKTLPTDAILMVTTGQGAIDELPLPPTCRRIVRLIEKPDHIGSDNDTVILDRPPYTVDGELALMRKFGVTHLLSKNSGGDQTRAKIDAAAELGIPIYMIRRPLLPEVAREVATVNEALAVIHEAASR